MRRAKHVMEAVLCCVILLIIHRSSESIQVIGGSRTVVQGEDVDLFCSLLETDEELEQITWQKRTLEEPDNHNFLLIYPTGLTDFISSNGLDGRVQFLGNPKENIGSIRITAARLLDEGTFTCVFSVFPSGAYSIEIPLTVQDPPQTVNITLSEASQATVFLCVADSNPKAIYTWTRVGQPWPQSAVRAEGDTLHLISLSSELNGLYTCEASNRYGRATGSQYVHVASNTSAACWVLLVIIFLIVVAAAGLIWYRWKNGKCLWSSFMGDQQFEVQSQVEEDEAGV
uniref:Ig-like domain-containing protein n=1 Tax=Hucho hucho TaxID=62062 RepID=A0A4W5P1N1_9TELE